MIASWDPSQYARFEAERRRPAEDLVARAPLRRYSRIADLGCGSALSTDVLARHYPHAAIVGVDTSEAMLASARERLPGCAVFYFPLDFKFVVRRYLDLLTPDMVRYILSDSRAEAVVVSAPLLAGRR